MNTACILVKTRLWSVTLLYSYLWTTCFAYHTHHRLLLDKVLCISNRRSAFSLKLSIVHIFTSKYTDDERSTYIERNRNNQLF
ncbi:hypothetical protein V8F06_009251 [Rhypophila decipiens]